jgi:hypothetical protein
VRVERTHPNVTSLERNVHGPQVRLLRRLNSPSNEVVVMKKYGERAALCALVAVCTQGAVSPVHADGRDDDDGYAIGLWGDLPYSTAQAAGVTELIADMNRQRLAFTVHDGDLKAGSSRCDDSVYTDSLAFFNSLEAPAAFTPGDNDWVDCDRASAGGYNSLERLDYERRLFFANNLSVGRRRMRQEVQMDKLCLDAQGTPAACVENRRCSVGDVTYVTLNVQGPCNNLCDTVPHPAEYAARNAARG